MAASYDVITTDFLSPNECLVYILNLLPFSDVDGYVYIASIVREYTIENRIWYDLLLQTDSEGRSSIPSPVTVTADAIVSNRSFRDVQPKQFYHFGTLLNSIAIEYPVVASRFVIKSKLTSPLESTSRSALGSGIYGRYIANPNNVSAYITNPEQTVYTIECPNAYPLQDKSHGDSVTVASLTTNRYLDNIIQALRDVISSEEEDNLIMARAIIQSNDSTNLVTLWNIVLYRTQNIITKDWLDELLARYAVKYLTTNSLVDSINGGSIQELPINDIITTLGYDGIIASDVYNNRWDRGCVCYNRSLATIIQGDDARY